MNASRPSNVEQIVQKAQHYDYNPLIPLKYWLRTAVTLLKEVNTASDDFVFYFADALAKG